uniref:rRNA-processing protein EBP2 n=1 Tax=Panagrolaimus sp. ES5 TaxID=591445 RepID=A0AC34GTM5_9BILA
MLKRQQAAKKLTAWKGPPPHKKAKLPEPPAEVVEEEESEIELDESFDEDDEIDTDSENEVLMEGEDEDEEESDDEFADMNAKSFVLADGKDDDDSDKEVEIALQAGLIDGKQFLMRAQKRELVNKVEEIKQKLSQMKSSGSWIKTVAVTASKDLIFDQDIDNDFEREALFYKQAQDGARQALAKLKQLNIPVARPADYFAEMVKSDSHMHRVRNVLLNKQKEKDRRDTVRRLRTEKKFASKVQKETEQQQRSDKRKFLEAVKKHRKGMKGQLETMLSNARSMDMDENDGPASNPHRGGGARVSGPGGKKKVSRTARDKKYGFGGIKRGNKRNDKASFNDIGKSKKGFGGRKPKFGKKR